MSIFMLYSICAIYCTLSKVLIIEMKAEIAEAKRLMDLGEGDGRPLEEKKGKRGKARV